VARLKKKILLGACRFIYGAARKRLLPGGLVFGVVGLLAGLARAEYIPPQTCYRMVILDPEVMALKVFPNPTGGAENLHVSAIIVDRGEMALVTGAELRLFTTGNYDKTWPMEPTDGKFDSDSEEVFLDLDISGLPAGSYYLYVSGIDAKGAQGYPASRQLMVEE